MIISYEEAGRRLGGVTDRTVRNLVTKGELKAFHYSGGSRSRGVTLMSVYDLLVNRGVLDRAMADEALGVEFARYIEERVR